MKGQEIKAEERDPIFGESPLEMCIRDRCCIVVLRRVAVLRCCIVVLRRVMAVSYTHLDVYKRQVLFRSLSRM